jgi:hypothetical protein
VLKAESPKAVFDFFYGDGEAFFFINQQSVEMWLCDNNDDSPDARVLDQQQFDGSRSR